MWVRVPFLYKVWPLSICILSFSVDTRLPNGQERKTIPGKGVSCMCEGLRETEADSRYREGWLLHCWHTGVGRM